MTETVVEVPTPLPLSRLAGVELMHTGTWDASTGRHTFTRDDLSNAVAALECPAVRRPILKLGHVDPRFDGEPAVGWLANMATTDDGTTLVADFVGMPGWLGPILASAFPDRSIEGQWNYRCALGHDHGFVLTGLALLGVSHPAIGTLTSLHDVATLFGVDVAASGPAAQPVTVNLKGDMMTHLPKEVAASVTTEDVRRAYYDTAGWSLWIEEFSLDPLQLIVVDDETGERSRIPVSVAPDGDGAEGVTFGDPVPVVVRYEDVSGEPADDTDESEAVAASANVLRYASRAESRPDARVEAATPAAAADGATTEGESGVEITNEQLAALRTALGLDDDADIDAIIAAVEKAVAAAADAAAASDGQVAAAAADSVVTIEREAFASLQREAALGRQAHERQEREDRERVVDEAIAAGKIPPARRDHWLTLMSADEEGTTKVLKDIPAETVVSLSEVGHNVNPDEGAGDDLGWFNSAPAAPKED